MIGLVTKRFCRFINPAAAALNFGKCTAALSLQVLLYPSDLHALSCNKIGVMKLDEKLDRGYCRDD